MDEVIIMDYDTACHSPGISTAALPCNPVFVHGLAMPYLTSAEFLLRATGRNCLVTVGVAVDATPQRWDNGRLHTESEIERFLDMGESLMRECG